MANTIRLRRGLEADRTTITPAEGEMIYTTDTNSLYIGDGSTAGGVKFDFNLDDIDVDTITANQLNIESGNVSFGDNDKAIFGAGSDLQIYHDGSNSYIKESGTGDLRLLGTNFRVKNAADTESMIVGTDNGGVYLYHAGVQKFVTTSTGIDVTGTVTADGLTVDADTLHVDATNNRIGIGTSSPSEKLEVNGNLVVTGQILGQIPQAPYGVSWDESTDSYTAIGGVNTLPIQSQMRRCTLNDNGTVNYYLDANDSTLKADGTSATLDGTDGQVMVEIPKFYYKHSMSGTVHTWEISAIKQNGFAVHPAFLKNGVEVDHRYIGAYEGSVSASKLGSASGVYPQVSQTRTTFRTQAAARGTGWRQADYYLHSAIQMLYLIEYQDLNSQEKIGNGRTGLSGGSWSNGSYIGMCGKSNGYGNQTANASVGGAVTGAGQDDFMSYRGIENFYGNIWEFRDGWTIDGDGAVNAGAVTMYATNNDADFADSGSTNMVEVYRDTAPHASGAYMSGLADISTGFIGHGAKMTGASNTHVGDYYWEYYNNGNGWRVPLVGTNAYYGGPAGVFALYVYNASSNSHVNFGSRVAF